MANTIQHTDTKQPEKSLGVIAWLIWGLAGLFYFYEFLIQVSPNVMAPELAQAFHANALSLGNLAAFYFYAYAAMQIPVGLLMDRFGPRRLLTIAALVCALGSLLFAQAQSLEMAQLGRFLTGLGSAFAVIGCFKVSTKWFPHRYFALVAGLMMTIGMAGAVFGEAPLAILISNVGWRQSMIILASIGVVLAIAIALFLRDEPKNCQFHYACSLKKNDSVFKGLKSILRNKQTWLVSIYGCLVYASIAALGALWGDSFLVAKYAIDRTTAAALISLLFIGFGISAPFLGWLTDYMGKRKPVLYIGSLGTFISLSLLIYAPLSYIMAGAALFFTGFFIAGFLPAFTILKEINSRKACATALAFMNMLNMAAAAAVQPLIGLLLDTFWKGTMLHNTPTYSLENYMIALSILPILAALSLLLLPFVKETYCRPLGLSRHHDKKS